MLKYKLTNQNMQTHKGCQWKIGETKTTDGKGELCNSGFLHFYDDPILAVFMNPVHADIRNPRIFECNAEGEFKNDRGLKGGCTKLTLVREIGLPKVGRVQQVAFGILCAKQVVKNKKWGIWADNWLNNTKRSKSAPITTATYTAYANIFAANSAANAATYTAAAYAAAVYAAYAAAVSAAYAIDAAAYAARATEFNLIEIAHKAVKDF